MTGSPYTIRPFEKGDETAISEMIAYTLRVSNRDDYTPEYLEDIVSQYSPDFQSLGLGKMIMAALESDDYFLRAHRTELGASITAAGFYEKLGYVYKNGITSPDESGVIKMEK